MYLWSDSTITLSWISKSSTKGNQFIQHWVAKIHTLTIIDSWHHIPRKLKPANCATRGLLLNQLKENLSWWNELSRLNNVSQTSQSYR